MKRVVMLFLLMLCFGMAFANAPQPQAAALPAMSASLHPSAPLTAVEALPGLPPFDCQGCPPAVSTITASVKALLQRHSEALLRPLEFREAALPGLPPFDCQGCPPAAG